MSILKLQVISSWLFVSLFIVMTHNSTVNLKLIQFLLWTKRSYQSSNFDTCKCSGETLQNSSCHFPSATSQLLFKSCITLQCHERIFLCTFLAQAIYTLLKRSSLKWQFLRLSSARVKFCQIPYARFETTSRFFSKFCITLQFHERLFLCTFLTQAIYTLLKRSSSKWKFLRLSSARVKFYQIPYANFEMTSRFFSKFRIPIQFHERLFLCTFSAQAIYTLLKRSPLKWQFLRLLSARIKFYQIPYANFETTSRFFS